MARLCRSEDRRLVSLIVSLACGYVAAIFVVIGLCTNYWIEIKNRGLYREETVAHFGLQRVCWTSSDKCTNSGMDYDRTNTTPAAQGILITGGFFVVAGVLLVLANLYLDRLGRGMPLFSFLSASIMALSGIILLIGIAVFGVKVQVRTEYITVGHVQFMGYSFGLVTTAGILLLVGSGFAAVTGCMSVTQKFNK